MSTLWGWRRRRYVYFHAKACFRDYLYAPDLYFANLEAEYFFLQVVLKLKSQTKMWNLAVNMFPNKNRQNQGFL